MNIHHNKILITGGATGIGLGLATRFVSENNQVIVCGRRTDALNDLKDKHPAVVTRQCDLSVEQERIGLYGWICAEHPDLGVLVNNAGIQQHMSLADDDFYTRAKEEMSVNIDAPLHLAVLFAGLPALKTIINVTSGLAFVPMVKAPVYCATKAFFHSFTLTLREMVRGRGIEVIELIPPALNTDLGGKGLHDYAPPVSDFIETVFAGLREGKPEISFGFSEAMTKAGPDELRQTFVRMNQAR